MNDKITTTDASTTNANSHNPICYNRYNRTNALSAEQSIAIHLLLAGHTDQKVADTVKVHRTTLTRWRLYHPLFQAELNRQRQGNAERISPASASVTWFEINNTGPFTFANRSAPTTRTRHMINVNGYRNR